jgi:hypothetical protein
LRGGPDKSIAVLGDAALPQTPSLTLGDLARYARSAPEPPLRSLGPRTAARLVLAPLFVGEEVAEVLHLDGEVYADELDVVGDLDLDGGEV